MPDLGTCRRHLAGCFAEAFADRPGPRQIGREAEYPWRTLPGLLAESAVNACAVAR